VGKFVKSEADPWLISAKP